MPPFKALKAPWPPEAWETSPGILAKPSVGGAGSCPFNEPLPVQQGPSLTPPHRALSPETLLWPRGMWSGWAPVEAEARSASYWLREPDRPSGSLSPASSSVK